MKRPKRAQVIRTNNVITDDLDVVASTSGRGEINTYRML